MRHTTMFAACLVFSVGSVASIVNAQEICRTAGFWGTHAGTERTGSTNISEEVIRAWLSTVNSYDQNDFPEGLEGIQICGKTISVENHTGLIAPVVEALCVSPGGDSALQLGRQLTAAALNCILSGGGDDCTGTSIYSRFTECNSACVPMAEGDQVNSCIEELDCFNNGGMWNADDPLATYCQMDVVQSCHDQLLLGTVMSGPADGGGGDEEEEEDF